MLKHEWNKFIDLIRNFVRIFTFFFALFLIALYIPINIVDYSFDKILIACIMLLTMIQINKSL